MLLSGSVPCENCSSAWGALSSTHTVLYLSFLEAQFGYPHSSRTCPSFLGEGVTHTPKLMVPCVFLQVSTLATLEESSFFLYPPSPTGWMLFSDGGAFYIFVFCAPYWVHSLDPAMMGGWLD